MTHVSILIVNYDGQVDTVACLRSLKKISHSHFSFSVVVVDNGSKETLEVAEVDKPDNTFILRSDRNLGFTDGNNLGYEYAQKNLHPDFILLLNNDTVVDPEFLEEMLKRAKKSDKQGIIAPKIYFFAGNEYHKKSYEKSQQGKVLWYAGGSIDWKNLDAFHRGVDEVDHGQFDAELESDFATGCAVLIPSKIIEENGFFEPKYFLYLEDVDLSMRYRLRGYPVYFSPKSVIWHKNAGSTGGSGSELQQYYQTRNRLFFFFRFGSIRTKLTVLRFAVRIVLGKSAIQRKAMIDWAIGQMGKKRLF